MTWTLHAERNVVHIRTKLLRQFQMVLAMSESLCVTRENERDYRVEKIHGDEHTVVSRPIGRVGGMRI